MQNVPFHLGAAATSALYALALEKIGPDRYEPDYTVLTVAAGVALTGGWVWVRLTCGPLPVTTSKQLVRWVWGQTVQMFVATGLPITAWQVWRHQKQVAELIEYLKDRYEYQANSTPTLAPERGRDATAHD